MKDKKIIIPKPCHEDWDTMVPNGNGKHCASCDKTVVDFTAMTLEQIQQYFDKNNGTKICGHFKATQVETNRPLLHRNLIRLYDFIEQKTSIHFFKVVSLSLVALCMALVGCQQPKMTGKLAPAPNANCNNSEQHLTGDTVYTVDGEPLMEVRDSIKGKK